MIWDDHQNRCIGELSFRSEVKAVKLRRDKVVVVLEYKIYVYRFTDLKLEDHIETISNPKGLCALCPSTSCVLACPGLQKGHVRVELFDCKKTTLIGAHETALACLSVNLDGTRLASCSEKGTLIRVWDTMTGQLLQELRRGADRAEIYSMAFNANSSFLAVSSDRGTIHIFNIEEDPSAAQEQAPNYPLSGGGDTTTPTNSKSTFSFLSNVLPRSICPKYISSEWSFAQFRVPDIRTICAFGQERNALIVVAADGTFFKCSFDVNKGGECEREVYARFIQAEEDD